MEVFENFYFIAYLFSSLIGCMLGIKKERGYKLSLCVRGINLFLLVNLIIDRLLIDNILNGVISFIFLVTLFLNLESFFKKRSTEVFFVNLISGILLIFLMTNLKIAEFITISSSLIIFNVGIVPEKSILKEISKGLISCFIFICFFFFFSLIKENQALFFKSSPDRQELIGFLISTLLFTQVILASFIIPNLGYRKLIRKKSWNIHTLGALLLILLSLFAKYSAFYREDFLLLSLKDSYLLKNLCHSFFIFTGLVQGVKLFGKDINFEENLFSLLSYYLSFFLLASFLPFNPLLNSGIITYLLFIFFSFFLWYFIKSFISFDSKGRSFLILPLLLIVFLPLNFVFNEGLRSLLYPSIDDSSWMLILFFAIGHVFNFQLISKFSLNWNSQKVTKNIEKLAYFGILTSLVGIISFIYLIF